MSQKSSILLNNFFLGGIADSEYSGIANSLASLVGCSIHAEPGILKASQACVKESGSTVDDRTSKMVPCSDGKTYMFGKSGGKIWSRTSLGIYALEATDAQGGILNGEEFDGYLFYCTANKVGRWQIGTLWSTRNDSYATFTVGNSSYHPMKVKNGVLYIGDGYLVAQVANEAGVFTFTGNALDLEQKFVITALGEIQDDLLVGAYVNTNVVVTKVFRWNTYSVSFTSDDEVPEMKINCFMASDNFVLVSAGQKGNLYTYGGQNMQQFKRIPGDWTNTYQSYVNSEASVNYNGIPLFGLSDGSSSALHGVYSFGSYSSNYPQVLNLEYIISTGHTSLIEITSMCLAGNDILIGWCDTNSGTIYGVDKVDWSNKFTTPYFETRVITLDRMNGKDFDVKIAYRTLNSGAITLQQKTNGGAYANVVLVKDALRNLYRTETKVSGAGAVKFKISLTGSANLFPEIEAMELSF